MSDEEISKFAPAMILAQQNKGGSRSSSENDKVSQSREEIQGIFAGQFIRLQNAIESGNMQRAEEILTGIDTLAGSITFKARQFTIKL